MINRLSLVNMRKNIHTYTCRHRHRHNWNESRILYFAFVITYCWKRMKCASNVMWMFVCVSVHHFTINIAILITHTLAHISSLQSVQLHNIHLFPTNIIAISHFLVPFPSSLKQRWWRTKTRVRFDCTLKRHQRAEQNVIQPNNIIQCWVTTWEVESNIKLGKKQMGWMFNGNRLKRWMCETKCGWF